MRLEAAILRVEITEAAEEAEALDSEDVITVSRAVEAADRCVEVVEAVLCLRDTELPCMLCTEEAVVAMEEATVTVVDRITTAEGVLTGGVTNRPRVRVNQNR